MNQRSVDALAALVFTKSFESGVAKTRLRPPNTALPDSFVDSLHRSMCEDVLDSIFQAKCFGQVVCAWTPKTEAMKGAPAPITHVLQQGDNFGSRLDSLLQQRNGRPFVLVGSDCPLLSPDILRQAADHLLKGKLVLGPSAEGGFYLLGVPGGRSLPFLAECFRGGSEISAVRAKFSELPLHLLEPLSDIDLEADLLSLHCWLALATEHNRTCDAENRLYIPTRTEALVSQLEPYRRDGESRGKALRMRSLLS